MDDSDSDLSSLSSVLSEPDEAMQAKLAEDEARPKIKVKGINKYFKPSPNNAKNTRAPTPEPPARPPSPPHEYVLADEDAVAFVVMFRSRFSDCFAQSLPHYGPQDIERGVSGDGTAYEQVERLLCALLTLCLNRKQPVEKGKYGRALEDAVQSSKKEGWPTEWQGANPLSGGKTFATMSPEERLVMLKAIILWSMESSEIVKAELKAAYKQTRREDDKNQPKAVQPWFTDSWRRKYYLIEGQDDTYFRIYRENDGKTSKTNVWFSVAGSIEEAKSLADKFENEYPGNTGKIMADKVRMAIPRWEAGEQKRDKREARLRKKAQFVRPEPGFSLYEGRTRGGKRKNYAEDGLRVEDDAYDSSSRPASGRSTPFDDNRPVVTASGRQVRSRIGGAYGQNMLTGHRPDMDASSVNGDSDDLRGPSGRPVRKSIPTKRSLDAREYDEAELGSGVETDDDVDEDGQKSADEWSGNEDEPDDESEAERENSVESDDELMQEVDTSPAKMVVRLRYKKSPPLNGVHLNGSEVPKPTPLHEVQNTSEMNGAMDITHPEPALESQPEAVKHVLQSEASQPAQILNGVATSDVTAQDTNT